MTIVEQGQNFYSSSGKALLFFIKIRLFFKGGFFLLCFCTSFKITSSAAHQIPLCHCPIMIVAVSGKGDIKLFFLLQGMHCKRKDLQACSLE
jgi:hypothetical protein